MSVFVAGVQPDSVAARDGRIQVGDELLEVSCLILCPSIAIRDLRWNRVNSYKMNRCVCYWSTAIKWS